MQERLAVEAVERWLRDVGYIYRSGAAKPEVAYYPPLEQLLNAVGAALAPAVRCVTQISSGGAGAGVPDGGLFTAEQFPRAGGGAPPIGTLPARGALEAKPPRDDARLVARGAQVAKYLDAYGQVLVTNLREWVLVGRGRDGRPEPLETHALAANEADFWALTATPYHAARERGPRFVEFLTRAMLHGAPLAAPKDVAWFLASYAREALARVERAPLDALAQVRAALEGALGLTFEGDKGDHFFRSTLVQTLFYGTFSGWVLWHEDTPPASVERFDWKDAGWELNVPMIRSLFHRLTDPGELQALGLVEVLNWTGTVLNRVDRARFFESFEAGKAVQYFYEPFLEAFDPELRKQLGVWYTPHEVVRYMVARVDTVLREELGVAAGLADERVVVLDPAAGTGSYLVEVLGHIAASLGVGDGDGEVDALAAWEVKRAAMERVFGFEIMPAPFVVAHLQLGLLLKQLGAPLSDEHNERVGMYLTNALTGWEAGAPRQRLLWPELEQERAAADSVKRGAPILVILGNPPYNGYAGLAMDEERDLSTAYRAVRRVRAPQGQGLNDLYVRFFRMAERKIVEGTGSGVVCYISNYSWLDGLSFTGMRERFLEVFDRVWVDNLNGDKYKTGKVTPLGEPDPSVFSTDWSREGIQVGTAIATLVRRPNHQPATCVEYRDLWGRAKRQELLQAVPDAVYETLTPPLEGGLPFTRSTVGADYFSWPLLPDLFPVSFPGVKTSRDDVVVDIDRDRLIARMRQYFDPAISHERMAQIAPGAMESTARFDARAVRDYLLKRGFLLDNVVRYNYRPFDVRWLYWEPESLFGKAVRS